MDDIIVPNFNSNLVLLKVWNNESEGLGDTQEFPIIAWRIVEDGDCPIPISIEGEMTEPNDVHASMVFDRITKIGTALDRCFHSREDCVTELHRVIAYETKRGVK